MQETVRPTQGGVTHPDRAHVAPCDGSADCACPPKPIGQRRSAAGTVISSDGTAIGYRRLGNGPGLVILHGSMSTGRHHLHLAEALADAHTVYVPDRRGFLLSGPCGESDGVQQDVEDLNALLTATHAHDVVGVSVGAIVVLEAALRLAAIRRLAVYEPPLFASNAAPIAMTARFDEEMASGDVAAALTTAMKGTPLVSELFSAMPRWIIQLMTERMLAFEATRGPSAYASFRELAPTLHHDGRIISEMSGRQESLRGIRADVLLLGGSKSTKFLKAALDGVAKVLPHAERIELRGLRHSSTWDADLRGTPNRVALELRRFFTWSASM